MNDLLSCRAASKADLPEILRLYAQPDLDDGTVLPLSEAECIFERMARYPDYTIYVAVCNDQIVGTFALAHKKGCYKAALSSNLKRERAHAFYESLGFERHGYSFRISTQRSGGQ